MDRETLLASSVLLGLLASLALAGFLYLERERKLPRRWFVPAWPSDEAWGIRFIVFLMLLAVGGLGLAFVIALDVIRHGGH